MSNNAKLSESEVKSILARIASGVTLADLAKEFEVTKNAIEYHVRKAQYLADEMQPKEEVQSSPDEKPIHYFPQIKRVKMGSGYITLSCEVNLFDLSEAEYTLLFTIIRAIRSYEQQ